MTTGASLNPNSMVEGAGLPSGNHRVVESRFTIFDYDGKADRPSLTLRWKLEDIETGEKNDQHYSAGDPTKIQPSADGKQAIMVGGTTGLNKNSNTAFLMGELINAGFPEDRLTLDASIFDGMEATFSIKPQPKRGGLASNEGKSIAVPSVILKLPWEDGPAASNDTGGNADLDAKTLGFVRTQLAAGGGSVKKQALGAAAFQVFAGDSDANAIVSSIFQPTFDALMAASGITVSGDDLTG